jgi:hypothetical protein
MPHVEAVSAEPRLQSPRQHRVDHREAQAAQQSARESLEEAPHQQDPHVRGDRADQAAGAQHGEARHESDRSADAVQHGIYRRRGDHRPDEVQRRHPRVDTLAADFVDCARQHADRQEFVGGIQHHAPGDQSGRSRIGRTPQFTPMAGGGLFLFR